MRLPDDTCIAGKKTVANWTQMKARLASNQDSVVWNQAFNEFFRVRLDTRYFAPIKAIEDMKLDVGEGFAIVALHCSLIEFLASTREGKSYRYVKNGDPPLDPALEYSNSKEMFSRFLAERVPFQGMFPTRGLAEDFYASVRCGLLHEARTKGQWLINVDCSAIQAVDTTAKVINRNKMREAFDQFVDCYGKEILTDAGLQQAFIRKFDSLCCE